ncbi:MAG: hypothetical protein IJC65_01980 [Oscillospiraceae bacterium]|nr:hypothetical protein [Oscillospiraceae bacterium]
MIKTGVYIRNGRWRMFTEGFGTFFIGALSYGLLEVLTRGFTHISMGLLGGMCFLFMSYTSELREEGNLTLIQQLICVTLFITVAELLCGIIINLELGLAVWDYSDMPFNLYGQICLPFSLLWLGITFIGIMADDAIKRYIYTRHKRSFIKELKAR